MARLWNGSFAGCQAVDFPKEADPSQAQWQTTPVVTVAVLGVPHELSKVRVTQRWNSSRQEAVVVRYFRGKAECREELMRQSTFEFCARRERKAIVALPAEVIKVLIRHMAVVIIEVSRPQGGKHYDGRDAEQ